MSKPVKSIDLQNAEVIVPADSNGHFLASVIGDLAHRLVEHPDIEPPSAGVFESLSDVELAKLAEAERKRDAAVAVSAAMVLARRVAGAAVV